MNSLWSLRQASPALPYGIHANRFRCPTQFNATYSPILSIPGAQKNSGTEMGKPQVSLGYALLSNGGPNESTRNCAHGQRTEETHVRLHSPGEGVGFSSLCPHSLLGLLCLVFCPLPQKASPSPTVNTDCTHWETFQGWGPPPQRLDVPWWEPLCRLSWHFYDN